MIWLVWARNPISPAASWLESGITTVAGGWARTTRGISALIKNTVKRNRIRLLYKGYWKYRINHITPLMSCDRENPAGRDPAKPNHPRCPARGTNGGSD